MLWKRRDFLEGSENPRFFVTPSGDAAPSKAEAKGEKLATRSEAEFSTKPGNRKPFNILFSSFSLPHAKNHNHHTRLLGESSRVGAHGGASRERRPGRLAREGPRFFF